MITGPVAFTPRIMKTLEKIMKDAFLYSVQADLDPVQSAYKS